MLLIYFVVACSSNKQPVLFEVLKENKTGIDFSNKLIPTNNFNVFHYMYFYNGAGVAAGDFNNDGLIDLFFSSNQAQNKIYLNTGNMHFKDVTAEAHIPNDGGWSTGVSLVDINNDGLLDIYVCRVGKYEILNSHNEFLICKSIDKNGVPQYEDEAKQYGLDFSGFSTQAAFFDYDGDGDLDMYLLNHSIHQNGTFGPRAIKLATPSDVSGDRLFRNDSNLPSTQRGEGSGMRFINVTKQAGINSSIIGYGLGLCVADVNMDGYPDIYIGNDFHEKDYLYINNHDGTFKEEDSTAFMHTSQYTMGVDVADINNDALPEIVSMDMLPSDPYILKRSEGEDENDIFKLKIKYGYSYQYTRNNLQYNRGNGAFSETGLYSGIAATDWSWSALWMDFDNDGYKDLFISNGIPKRLNDIDYINYVSNDQVQMDIRLNNLNSKDMSLIDKFPEIKIPNRFYKNDGSLSFTDEASSIKNDAPNFSNGAVYADFDNDGDLDIAVNNINDNAMIYENKSNDNKKENFIELKLKGDSKNINAIGSKVIVFTKKDVRTYEKFPVHGFLSSAETPLHIGLHNANVDSIVVIWFDNSYQKINWQSDTGKISTIAYTSNLPQFNYDELKRYSTNTALPMQDITPELNLNYKHIENEFPEFDREPLIPHMTSSEGPALAVADINHDGLDDVFIGASRRNKPAVFIQNISGKFEKINEPALDKDSSYEDVDACWADVNNDKKPDLIIASGGNEYYGNDSNMLPRVYLNDGKGNLSRKNDAFTNVYAVQSCVAACDFNHDGNVDIFIGARAVPFHYGETPQSYLLMNDGTGKFKDVTNQLAQGLSNIGMVTNAIWFDIDKDGDKDLIISMEWSGIIAFINNNGHFTKKILTNKKGWWNFVLPADIDGDGDIDLIAGNLGLNSRLHASDTQPVRMYINDFDDNGNKEQILTYYLDNKEIPFANKAELQKQMPSLKKKYLYAGDFAKASLTDLFSESKLKSSEILTANWLYNSVLINDGKLNFTVKPMPWQAQLSPYRDAIVTNANNDNLPDVLLGGNYYDNNIQMGRYDADYGTILLNKGSNSFMAEPLNGVVVKGQVRHIKHINLTNNKAAYVLARNNDSLMVIDYKIAEKK